MAICPPRRQDPLPYGIPILKVARDRRAPMLPRATMVFAEDPNPSETAFLKDECGAQRPRVRV